MPAFLANPGFWKGVGSVGGALLGSLGGGGGGGTVVDPAQQPFLDFSRNRARALAGANIPGASAFSGQAGQQLFQQGVGFLDNLAANPFLAALQQQAGGNSDLVQQQIGQLQADLGRSFQQEILPGIRRDATAVGALGGSRQGIAEGLAGQGFADAFGRGVTDIYSADAGRALQAAVSGGGLQAQSALGGLSSLPGLFDVGLSQFTGGFAPLMLANNIFGPPTTLQQESGGSGLLGGLF